ncbi:hypothetical protein STEG23_019827 [Scotinomys teguina]
MQLLFALVLESARGKVKRFGLIALAKEISKQSSIDSVMWLLVFILRKMYNEKEQGEEGKIQNVQIEEKRDTTKWNGAKPYVQGDEQINEEPDVKWNKGSGDFRTRPNPFKFPTFEKALKKSLELDVMFSLTEFINFEEQESSVLQPKALDIRPTSPRTGVRQLGCCTNNDFS